MYRDAERQFKSAIADQPMIDTYLYLAKVYLRLDQPLAAIDVYKQGLVKFPQEVSLLLGQARVYEVYAASLTVNTASMEVMHSLARVYLLAVLHKNYLSDLHKIRWKGVTRATEESIRFWC